MSRIKYRASKRSKNAVEVVGDSAPGLVVAMCDHKDTAALIVDAFELLRYIREVGACACSPTAASKVEAFA